MRLRYIRVALGILFLAVFGTQLLTSTITAFTIEASVDIKPETFNLNENGVITALIELPSPYNVTDIEVDTIKLHMENAEDYVVPIRCDIDEDIFIAKFDASNVANYILSKLIHMQIVPPQPKYFIDLVVEGKVIEVSFKGCAQIRIMLQ